jgi:hypothetical protein
MQPLMQAVICVRQLMRRISAEERLPIATGAIANAGTLKFVCDCARWLSAGDGTVEPILTSEEEDQRELLSERGSQCISRRNPNPLRLYFSAGLHAARSAQQAGPADGRVG